ncbi:MAG: DUF1501 domain-containing protein [Alphaproteobacteria bacterium]
MLVELAGGNDGLNTVVPYDDPAYRQLRPRIGISRDQILQLSDRLGLHPGFKPLMPSWQAKDFAVVLGLGYETPNRSHFRSLDIWETGSNSNQILSTGWLAQLLAGQHRAPNSPADAIVLGGEEGAVTGQNMHTLTMRNPERFIEAAKATHSPERTSDNPALAHILRVQQDSERSIQRLKQVFAAAPSLGVSFPATPLGRQLDVAARLIAARSGVPVFKTALGGFDTHFAQPVRHASLLQQLAEALAAFRAAMIVVGAWERVLLLTYSEFGRRAGENGSNGTDHGTAAPHFALGGRVRGGLIGMQPSLADLADGDLRYSADYRTMYAAAAETWFALPHARRSLGGFAPQPIIRA